MKRYRMLRLDSLKSLGGIQRIRFGLLCFFAVSRHSVSHSPMLDSLVTFFSLPSTY